MDDVQKLERDFESYWKWQKGSLMLKDSNSSIEWKKTIAREFFMKGIQYALLSQQSKELNKDGDR